MAGFRAYFLRELGQFVALDEARGFIDCGFHLSSFGWVLVLASLSLLWVGHGLAVDGFGLLWVGRGLAVVAWIGLCVGHGGVCGRGLASYVSVGRPWTALYGYRTPVAA